ncbi:hypothetical protein, partial [Arsukibacterium sp.]|uniref:hypothetical protein n=1 Tax=Arsukibacterium sp. TaxID=1977258 RepID=UPI002FDAB5AD
MKNSWLTALALCLIFSVSSGHALENSTAGNDRGDKAAEVSAQQNSARVEAQTVLFLGPLPALASEALALGGKEKEQRQQLLRLLEKQPVPVAGRKVSLFGQE